jgi:hypothetical protein
MFVSIEFLYLKLTNIVREAFLKDCDGKMFNIFVYISTLSLCAIVYNILIKPIFNDSR